MTQIKVGQRVETRSLDTIQATRVDIPDSSRMTHIQFRRFVGCPICHLNLRSFGARHEELVATGIQEVAVFHSSKKAMLDYKAEAPFALVADPTKALYAAFGVDNSLLSILHPGAWFAAVKGIFTIGPSLPPKGESPLGLPADFLIARDGRVIARKYGVHADDQWTVDEVLDLARQAENPSAGVASKQEGLR